MISARDVDNVYKVPLVLRAEGMDDLILDHFAVEAEPPDLSEWEELVRRADACEGVARIALVGKYVQLEDAYKSVIEALNHGGYHHGINVDVKLVDSEDFDAEEIAEWADGILIPGGFGERGIEGKIEAARVARENEHPLSRHLPRHADRGRRVRAQRRRDGRRQLDRVRPRDALPGRRPASRAEGGLRHGRDDAAGRGPREDPRGHAGPGDLRRGGHLQAPPPPLRGEQPASAAPRGRGARGRRDLARTSGSSRSSSSPSTRSSSPRSSTPSSTPGPRARSRCSASSSERPPATRAGAGRATSSRPRTPRPIEDIQVRRSA